MIFYHFTPIMNTDHPRGGFMRRPDGSPVWVPGDTRPVKIGELIPASEGLTPDPRPDTGWGGLEIPGAPKVVWLTRDPRTVYCEKARNFRITVRIPATDRRLINWKEWEERNLPDEPEEDDLSEITRHWYGYRGKIPLSWIVDIRFLMNQEPPWIDCLSDDPRVDGVLDLMQERGLMADKGDARAVVEYILQMTADPEAAER